MPITLYPSRLRMIGLLILSAMFVAGGIWMVRSGEWTGYFVSGFFGLGIPVFLIQIIPGSGFLHIDAEGFTFSSLFRKHTFAWSDIDEFYVVTTRHSGLKTHEMVGFNFMPTYDRSRTGRRLARALADCEGALPDTYGKRAADLADLLNTCLQEAQTRSSA